MDADLHVRIPKVLHAVRHKNSKEDISMKKILALALVLMMTLTAAAFAEGQLGFLPPAMTSPFYASCIEGATPVAEALGYELVVMAPES